MALQKFNIGAKRVHLHSIVHGRDSVYTAFTDGVGADPYVLLQLVQIGELGRAPVHLERATFDLLYYYLNVN